MKVKIINHQEMIENLKNPSLNYRYKVIIEEGKHKKKMKQAKNRYTLNQIGDALFTFIKTTNERFDRIEKRLDHIVEANNLKDLPKNQ